MIAPNGVVCAYAADGDLTTPVRPLMARNVSLRFVLIYGVPDAALARRSPRSAPRSRPAS